MIKMIMSKTISDMILSHAVLHEDSTACIAHCNYNAYTQTLLQSMLIGADACPLVGMRHFSSSLTLTLSLLSREKTHKLLRAKMQSQSCRIPFPSFTSAPLRKRSLLLLSCYRTLFHSFSFMLSYRNPKPQHSHTIQGVTSVPAGDKCLVFCDQVSSSPLPCTHFAMATVSPRRFPTSTLPSTTRMLRASENSMR